MSSYGEKIEAGLARAWNRESARTNMDRWLTVCDKENWGNVPDNIDMLLQVFGASWYFTRFIFFRGRGVSRYLDEPLPGSFPRESLQDQLLHQLDGRDFEERMDVLRLRKNEIMLQIFIAWLGESLDQTAMETALTHLAEASLWATMQLLIEEHENMEDDIAILAMGRMAGYEMNFGSDLDLIFLYSGRTPEESTDLIKQIQKLMRHIALPSPAGILYEVDMRLRPHGTSGTLITPANYFIEYHTGKREIWERQMMTRCRPVLDDNDDLAAESLTTVREALFQHYDNDNLREQILSMRSRVEKELGSPKGKYEIKRGYGGIMDIDFLTHYLQLQHGHEHENLRTASTREALRQCASLDLLTQAEGDTLLQSYDFLKRIECSLRVADMKSTSAFSQQPADLETLARAMGYREESGEQAAGTFLEAYQSVTETIRHHFEDKVGKL